MTDARINYSTGATWELLRGYSRAVQVGNRLYISGTTAANEKGQIYAPGKAFEQTERVIQNIKAILKEAGFTMQDVVKTRLSVTDISQWEEYARAHRQAFDSVRPASSFVEVAKLRDPRMMIEMEVEAEKGFDTTESRDIKY